MATAMGLLTLPTGELEVEDHGAGETVILIHGGDAADEFLPLAREPILCDHYRVIRYHRRGNAGSAAIDGPVTIERHAADSRALLETLNVRRAHVVGKSFGGAIALQLAVDAPTLVHSLSLFEPAVISVPSGPQFFAALAPVVELYLTGNPVQAVNEFFTAVWGPDWKRELRRAVPDGPEQAERDAATLFESELPALQEWRFGADEAATIAIPVLYLLGSESLPMCAEGRDLLRTWLPQLEDTTLPGANHLLQIRDPAGAAVRLTDFLQRHPMSP